MEGCGILRYVKLISCTPIWILPEEGAGGESNGSGEGSSSGRGVEWERSRGLANAASLLTALTATPQGNRAFLRLGFKSRYVETKADGDNAEMLVREGNDAFTSSS